jgi:hypothetical protein
MMEALQLPSRLGISTDAKKRARILEFPILPNTKAVEGPETYD